uniref:Uncharacterized protein n=1 Tax=Anguilla anguilla TaxID=7936 RepID=A0A0E9R3V7_ANGAN
MRWTGPLTPPHMKGGGTNGGCFTLIKCCSRVWMGLGLNAEQSSQYPCRANTSPRVSKGSVS